MCGITGFNWQDETLIRKLTELLHHRGPDQEGCHIADGVSLGHKRLSIIDLSDHGRQPLYNEDGKVGVVYNGEIFNFQDLKIQLQQKGHQFRSHTDTEVLVHGYEEWGTALPEHLNGQFAFCIFDSKLKTLFLARDRMGIKPLYLFAENGQFIFGSEMKVLLEAGIPKVIDSQALDHYWLFGYTTGRRSILSHVRQLSPGHFLIYDLQTRSIRQESPYWRLHFAEPTGRQDIRRVGQELVSRLEHSVKLQLISDVPLGAFLSGGVDSSILVALMTRHKQQLKTFSIRFDYEDFNESRWAQQIADQFGTEHHEILFGADDVGKLIPKLPDFYDEPYSDASMIPTCLVCAVARQHVTVSLSGTGGDELFAGYPRYREFEILRTLNHLAAPVRRTLDVSVGTINRFLKSDKMNKLQAFLQQPLEDYQLYPMLLSYMFRTKDEAQSTADWLDMFKSYFVYSSNLNNLLNMDMHHYLPDDLLVKEDRASMAVSLEARVPFLDHTFVEFAAGLSPQLKRSRGQLKYILKKAFEGVLPDEILYRPKRGFGVPLVHYFRKELKSFAEEILFDSCGQDFFDPQALRGYWQRHQAGLSDYSRIFWSVIMYKLWYQRWMK